jgi:hypothetical protein
MKLDQPAFGSKGLSNRELAAIYLCVPESGDPYLDAMIRRAQRDRLAEKIVQGIITGNHADPIVTGEPGIKSIVRDAYRVADALIAAGGNVK